MDALSGQLAIDFSAFNHARRSDPETSKEAASRVREFAAGQCAEILYLLRRYGPLSPEQLATLMAIDAYAVRKRTADLQKAGKARPNGLTCATVSGRRQRIWEAI